MYNSDGVSGSQTNPKFFCQKLGTNQEIRACFIDIDYALTAAHQTKFSMLNMIQQHDWNS